MGYGGAYCSQTNRGSKRYDNAGVSHAWNSGNETGGQSGNGNFYFEGRALYSYGSHFLVGFIMPDGVAFLNANYYSISTSGHLSAAWSASSNRPRFNVAKLGALETLLAVIAGKRVGRAYARGIIRANAESLAAARLIEPNGNREGTGESAGEYLTRLVGLPAASWPKLEREAAALKAKAAKASAKAELEGKRSKAIRLADVDSAAWRRALSVVDSHGGTYGAAGRLESLALELHRGVRFAKVDGFSAKRRAKLSARHKEARARLESVEAIAAIANKRSNMRRDLETIRQAETAWQALATAGELPDYHRIANLTYVAKAAAGLSDSLALPAETRERLAFASRRIEAERERLMAEHREREAVERIEIARVRELREAEHKAQWLAGEAYLGGLRFDSDHGGAAIRILGNRLETSHGAAVPLADAVKVFRFIKLVKARGEVWKRNGATIRVGSFQVDSIELSGAFVAGCHSFAWQEVEKAAIAAGVFDATPSAEAVISSAIAA